MQIKGFDLELTCSACPEQYDVFKDGQQVGYLRLRWGSFTADYPNCGGQEVYSAEPKGDGSFYDDDERMQCLTEAIDAIEKACRLNQAGVSIRRDMSEKKMTGSEMIAAERKRQIEEEGWTPENDAEHRRGDLARAGGCYAYFAAEVLLMGIWAESSCFMAPPDWPWDKKFWKPTPKDPIKQLTKAGALIAAEIDRIQGER